MGRNLHCRQLRRQGIAPEITVLPRSVDGYAHFMADLCLLCGGLLPERHLEFSEFSDCWWQCGVGHRLGSYERRLASSRDTIGLFDRSGMCGTSRALGWRQTRAFCSWTLPLVRQLPLVKPDKSPFASHSRPECSRTKWRCPAYAARHGPPAHSTRVKEFHNCSDQTVIHAIWNQCLGLLWRGWRPWASGPFRSICTCILDPFVGPVP